VKNDSKPQAASEDFLDLHCTCLARLARLSVTRMDESKTVEDMIMSL